jgi:hypothetical protein
VERRELAVVEHHEPVLARRGRLLRGIGGIGTHEDALKLRWVEVEFFAEVFDVLVRTDTEPGTADSFMNFPPLLEGVRHLLD